MKAGKNSGKIDSYIPSFRKIEAKISGILWCVTVGTKYPVHILKLKERRLNVFIYLYINIYVCNI